ncbi:MAG: J domain-containing protein [Alphaproteobacteria bacterium]|nr:J domain-containing protein [Alphaproteobacteria bacterium]
MDQLAEHAAQHKGDRVLLSQLLIETERRPGARAKLIARRIEHALATILTKLPGRGAPPEEMRRYLAIAAGETAILRNRLQDAEAELKQLKETPADGSAHARIYLAPNRPLWLIVEVRRAFRRRYHPDKQTDPAKRHNAKELFKCAEEVFETLQGR